VQQFGMEGPMRGYLFESEVRKHGDTLNFRVFARLAIEGEMALRIGADGSIAAVFPVIELHHFVFRGRRALTELVANNGLNGSFVFPHADWLLSQEYVEKIGTLNVLINGHLIASGELWPMSGGAHASLAWLRNHLAQARLALLPGHIILAGTPFGLYPVRSGDEIAVFVDDRAGVEFLIL
jgi:2-keto-4-pentenoate hydratase